MAASARFFCASAYLDTYTELTAYKDFTEDNKITGGNLTIVKNIVN